MHSRRMTIHVAHPGLARTKQSQRNHVTDMSHFTEQIRLRR